jgi:PAS domain S-box-containing protein
MIGARVAGAVPVRSRAFIEGANDMRAFIRPASFLMQRLKYPQKFLLIAVVIAIPFAVIFGLLQAQINADLHTLHQERAGNAYLTPVRQLLGHVSQAQVFAHVYANGNTAIQPTLMDRLSLADSDIAALAAEDARNGHILGSTGSLGTIRAEWADVRDGSVKRSTSDNDAVYAKLIDDLHELIETVKNRSLLVVDGQLDSTLLTQALLDRLVTGVDLFRETKLRGQDLPYGQPISPAARLGYDTLVSQLTANLQATRDSFDNAFGADTRKALQPALGTNVTDYVASGQGVLDLVGSQVTNSPTITATPATYDATISRAWQINDQLSARSSAELESILKVRVDDTTARHRLAQVLPLLAALVAIYLLIGFYHGFTRVIAALAEAARRMTGGEIDHAVALNTRDEMGKVVISFNTIAARLRAEWVQAREESDRATAAEAKLRSIVDTALDGIVTIDVAGRISAWNPQAETIFGWSAREAIGMPAADLISPAAQPEFMRRVDTMLRTGVHEGADNRFESAAMRRDGGTFPAEVAIASLQRRDSAFSLFIRDITERVRLRDQEIDYLRNVALVTDAAAAVEVGTFDAQHLAPVAVRDDGLGQLARVFERMAREVAGREQQLRLQVQELRIEIDHHKTAQAAAAITETDYFKTLQQQAKTLRKRSPADVVGNETPSQ